MQTFSTRLENTPRKSLKNQIDEIWEKLSYRFNIEDSRFPTYFVHASPGMGKTFLLHELISMKKCDIPYYPKRKEFYDKVQFIGITFNSKTKYDHNIEKTLSIRDLFWSRVFYSEFVDQTAISWSEFLIKFVIMSNDDIVFLKLLINKYKSKELFVFLIDDLTEITHKPSINHLVSSMQYFQNYHQTPIKISTIFATSDSDIMYPKDTINGSYNRELTKLSLFSIKSSMSILANILNNKRIEIMMCDKIVNNDIKLHALIYLSTISSGHAKSLEYIIDAIVSETNTGGVSLSSIFNLAADLYEYPEIFSNINVVKISCFGEKVKLRDLLIDDPEKRDVFDLVTNGVILDSLSSRWEGETSPKISLLLMRKWAKLRYGKERIANILTNIFNLSNDSSHTSFEQFHGHWEMLYRSLNRGNTTYNSISINNFYKNPKLVVNKSGVFDTKVDLSNDLEIVYFEKKDILNIDINKVFLPKEKNIASFDSLIFVNVTNNDGEKEGNESLLALFIQNIICDVDSNSGFKYNEVKKSITKSKKFLNEQIGNTGTLKIVPVFIFLRMCSVQEHLTKLYQSEDDSRHQRYNNEYDDKYMAQQNFNNKKNHDDNIMILDENELEKLYGVNLFHIPGYLRLQVLYKEIEFQKQR